MAKVVRPDVPGWMTARVAATLERLPGCAPEDAWTGIRWRVGQTTVAHLFGGEDQRFRLVFWAPHEEVLAFENLGPPYFRCGWGEAVVGMELDEHTDWDEVGELLTDSYRVQAPRRLVEQLDQQSTLDQS